MIRLINLHKAFGTLRVLRGVDLEIPAGKITVILGPSGTGKSVMLKHIIGLLQPDAGRVVVGGVDVASLDSPGLAAFRKQFGMVFQNAALFDSMSVFENVAFPLRESGERSEAKIRQRVQATLRSVGLVDVDDRMPAELSGGMRKRVGVARAIIQGPSILLYDEPTTGLDPLMTDAIDQLILAMQRELHVTTVVISHDIQSSFHIGDQIAMLSGGKVLEVGTPEQLQASRNEFVRRFVEGRSQNGAPDETLQG